jgi:hypothetical protein
MRTWPVLAGLLVVVGPWAVRNWTTFGVPIVTTTHGGYTLLLAHNPVYDAEVVREGRPWPGASLKRWQAALERELKADLADPENEIARDRWMGARAWRHIRQSPLGAIRAGLTLQERFWRIVPASLAERPIPTVVRGSIGLFYGLIFAAAGAGLLRLKRDEWPAWMFPVLLIVSFAAVHCLYWADMRMRVPLVPAIAVLAARGISRNRSRVGSVPHRK